MATIFTGGDLADLMDFANVATGPITDATWLDWRHVSGSYAVIYRSQPNVRTVVDFISRNCAQLGLHAFRKVSHEDRQRVTDHPIVGTLTNPSPSDDVEKRTPYEFIDELLHDILIYDRAYVLKVREGRDVKLRRLAPRWVWPQNSQGVWNAPPEFYRYRGRQDIPPDKIIAFRGYDPDGYVGVSPMETLRHDLELDMQGQMAQLQLYRNGSRIRGWIERPADAPVWADEKRERFRSDWRSLWTGEGPDTMGTPVLEDGMKFHGDGFSPEQTKYLEERRLSMERACAAYHVHPTMLGISQGTYANTREFHKMLYQDTLGPTLEQIQSRLDLDLLAEWTDARNFYLEFNVMQKLQGDFEEQSAVMQRSVGRPWMSANEARQRMNLGRIDEPSADALVVPLNVLVAGVPSPPPLVAPPGLDEATRRAQPRRGLRRRGGKRGPVHRPEVAGMRGKMADALGSYFRTQRGSIVNALKAAPPLDEVWDQQGYDAALAALLLQHKYPIAKAGSAEIIDEYAPDYAWDDEPMLHYLSLTSADAAHGINLATFSALAAALGLPDWRTAVGAVFDNAEGWRAQEIANTQAQGSLNFGRHEAARGVGLRTKTWTVTSANPRASHAELSGVTVGIDEDFPNGARWPCDPVLDASEAANCTCQLDYGGSNEDAG
jgi:HK97 family phage portal protein